MDGFIGFCKEVDDVFMEQTVVFFIGIAEQVVDGYFEVFGQADDRIVARVGMTVFDVVYLLLRNADDIGKFPLG